MDSNRLLDMENQPLLDLGGIIARLWRRKMVIVACFGAGILLGMGYLVVTKSVYTAQTVIVIDPREATTTTNPNVLSGIGSDSAAIASQLAIITSSELLRSVFEPYKTDPEFASSGGLLSSLRGGGTASPEVAFARFKSHIDVAREGLTYVLNLSFTSTDPKKAAVIANDLANKYISGQVSEKSGANSEVNSQLNDSVAQLRTQVAAAETAVDDYRTANNLFDTGSGRTLIEGQVDQLNAQLSIARETARVASSQYDQARAIGTSLQGLDRLTQILSSGSAETLRDSYNLRIAELANAQASLGPQHPTVVRLQAEVRYLSTLMREEAERIIASLKATAELADTNVKRINDDLVRLQTQSSMSSQQSVQLRQLERNADASRQVLEQFLARSEQVSQQGQLQRPDARIVSLATPPLKASWPRGSLVLGGAGLFGLMIGCMVALFTGREPEEEIAQSRAPAQPLEPAQRPQSQARSARPSAARRSRQVEVEDLGILYTRYQPPQHYRPSTDYMDTIRREVLDYPQDDFAEAVNALMQDLLADLPRRECGMISLTSVGDRLEKARLAFALATELRQAGIVPLIIDLDPLIATAPPRRGRQERTRRQVVDAETGLAVITAPALPTDRAPDDEDTRVEEILCDYTDAYDLVLIISKSVTEPDAMETMFTGAHHTIAVLNSDEDFEMAQAALMPLAKIMRPPQTVTVDYGRYPVVNRPTRREELRATRPVRQRLDMPEALPAESTSAESGRRAEVSSVVEELRRAVRRAAS